MRDEWKHELTRMSEWWAQSTQDTTGFITGLNGIFFLFYPVNILFNPVCLPDNLINSLTI